MNLENKITKMIIVESIEAIKKICKSSDDGRVIVPTMGALHEGHVALLDKAREFDQVIATLFINPLQFNNLNDLTSYPIAMEDDIDIFDKNGVDVLFMPSKEGILNQEQIKTINAGPAGDIWEGSFRPGHFDGVLTIVNRFFELIRPSKAIFGLKDIQQICLIHNKLSSVHNVEIIPVETQRDSSGLAYSSRNSLITEDGKQKASIIFKALKAGKEYWKKSSNISGVEEKVSEVLSKEPDFKLQYIDVKPLSDLTGSENDFSDLFKEVDLNHQVIMIAGYIEGIRLIDNIIINSNKY
ncbi:MAG: pantoate--beta-alanine ligase [Dehalococcoidia bacterium]|nr:pantoate--beta-alanine ligase [Dehalococcoidia bacterium]|tara:strand:+ start:1088 stop:1978 length:891 start_codon:yes stop_codon:yes gene_type:complete